MNRPLIKEMVSVVIPVYNVEKYLERCVYSVLNQSYKKLDIILVNDGSTDNSRRLCDQLAKEDSRISVIHKANGGLSSARNAGLDNVRGEYLFFLDSDDWLELDGLEKLVKIAKKEKVDFVRFRPIYAEFPDKPNGELYEFEIDRQLENGRYSRNKIIHDIFPRMFITSKLSMGPIVGAYSFYSTSFILNNNIRFYEDIRFSEDLCFSSNVVWKCDSFYYTNDLRIYNYFYNPSSISRSFRRERWNSCKRIIYHFDKDFGPGTGWEDQKQLNRLRWFCVFLGLNESRYLNKKKDRINYKLSILKDPEFPNLSLRLNDFNVNIKLYSRMVGIKAFRMISMVK